MRKYCVVSHKQWMLKLSNLCHCVQHPWKHTSRDFWSSRNKRKPFYKQKSVLRKYCGVSQKQWMLELSNLCHCVQHPWKLTSRDFWSSRNERKPFYKQKSVLRKCCGISQKQWMLELSNLCHCVQHPWKLTSRDFWSSRKKRKLLIRLLSLFEYMLEDSGSAENKEILLFSHDKLLLASILRPLHQGKYYKQTQGAAMGSPISPLIANIFMEEFEVQALQSSPNPPSMWLRFVGWHFCYQQDRTQPTTPTTHKQSGPTHTVYSGTYTARIAPFPGHFGHHTTRQHTKYLSLQKTHTYRPYLHWDSNHHITAKHSVYNTLAHRAKTVSSTQDSLDQELLHIKTALQLCQFPNWP